MIEVTRTRRIDASPEALFAVLSDPANLAGMLPRVRSVDVLEQTDTWARIATHMAFGPFGTIRNEGEARWQHNREVSFLSRTPIVVESRWTLSPADGSTNVTAELRLDLAPLIGPLVAFVPPQQVIAMVGPELDAALQALASKTERSNG